MIYSQTSYKFEDPLSTPPFPSLYTHQCKNLVIHIVDAENAICVRNRLKITLYWVPERAVGCCCKSHAWSSWSIGCHLEWESGFGLHSNHTACPLSWIPLLPVLHREAEAYETGEEVSRLLMEVDKGWIQSNTDEMLIKASWCLLGGKNKEVTIFLYSYCICR